MATGAAFASDHALAAFAGTYRYVGGKNQVEKLEKAVEEACEGMNFVVRPLAQPRIVKSLYPVATVNFRVSGSQTSIARPGIPTMTGDPDGGRFSWVDKRGLKSKVSFDWKGSTLRVVVKQSDGYSVVDWRFSDGGRLGFRMKIEHDKLTNTLRYGLSYKR
jgi:hypothetical protein